MTCSPGIIYVPIDPLFRSVPELTDAIMAYIGAHNEDPKSFEWTAKAEDIIEKVRRAREVLNKSASA
jgi:hypothetical protein